MCDSHLTCKVGNKCLNAREWVAVVEWNKKWSPYFPMLSCESSVSVKKNPGRKKTFTSLALIVTIPFAGLLLFQLISIKIMNHIADIISRLIF